MVAGSKSSLATKSVHALWVNMREEPVVYINGCPFVLREEVSTKESLVRVTVVYINGCPFVLREEVSTKESLVTATVVYISGCPFVLREEASYWHGRITCEN
jgi:hypothetical protein